MSNREGAKLGRACGRRATATQRRQVRGRGDRRREVTLGVINEKDHRSDRWSQKPQGLLPCIAS